MGKPGIQKLPSIPCPSCGNRTRVIAGFSRLTTRGLRRKRNCQTCGLVFITYQKKGEGEIPDMIDDNEPQTAPHKKLHMDRLEEEQTLTIDQRRRQLINLAILNSRFEEFRAREGFDEVVLREAKKIREMKVGVE